MPPDVGDIVWLNFTPQFGKEQPGQRPALVLSPQAYIAKSGLMVVCPINSKPKGYSFEVGLPEGLSVRGVVLADHLKSVDWKSRSARTVDRVSDEILDHVRAKVSALLMIDQNLPT